MGAESARAGAPRAPLDHPGADPRSPRPLPGERRASKTATFAAHLDYLTTIASWLADYGVGPDAATAYTTHIFGQLGESLSQRTDSLTALTDKHMTPGGINQQFMTDLRRDGVPDVVRRALDRVLARLRK